MPVVSLSNETALPFLRQRFAFFGNGYGLRRLAFRQEQELRQA